MQGTSPTRDNVGSRGMKLQWLTQAQRQILTFASWKTGLIFLMIVTLNRSLSSEKVTCDTAPFSNGMNGV